jgi:hypothetical protein
MTPAALMLGAALVVWLAVVATGSALLRFDVALGMLGPVVVAVTTWLWMDWAYRRSRSKFTAHMTAAFGFTAVSFAAYVTGVLVLTSVRSVPFAVAFTASFIALHAMEAFFLWRMLQSPATSGS